MDYIKVFKVVHLLCFSLGILFGIFLIITGMFSDGSFLTTKAYIGFGIFFIIFGIQAWRML